MPRHAVAEPRPSGRADVPASRYPRMAACRAPVRVLAVTTSGRPGVTLDGRSRDHPGPQEGEGCHRYGSPSSAGPPAHAGADVGSRCSPRIPGTQTSPGPSNCSANSGRRHERALRPVRPARAGCRSLLRAKNPVAAGITTRKDSKSAVGSTIQRHELSDNNMPRKTAMRKITTCWSCERPVALEPGRSSYHCEFCDVLGSDEPALVRAKMTEQTYYFVGCDGQIRLEYYVEHNDSRGLLSPA